MQYLYHSGIHFGVQVSRRIQGPTQRHEGAELIFVRLRFSRIQKGSDTFRHHHYF